jgi:alpha-beta hydrolase superfamily lysophospholipase
MRIGGSPVVWIDGIAVTIPEVVHLVTSDGHRLRRREWSAESARAVVVLVHGFVGSADHPALIREARALQADGFDVLSYDSRGHGRSEGVCTLGDLESLDVAAAVESVKSKGLPVVLVGASMGAVAVLRYAASSGSELAGVVAVSAPASWRVRRSPRGVLLYILTRTAFGRFHAKRHVGVSVTTTWTEPAPPVELVRHISVPVAIIHGRRDPYIASAAALAIHEACASPWKHLEIVSGVGHAYDEKAIPAISDAVNWILAVTNSPRFAEGASLGGTRAERDGRDVGCS